jgi:hypothetical protein
MAWFHHFTTWLNPFTTWLDHRQTLATGLTAIVAAVIAVGVPECFARRRAKQELQAMRLSLGVEIRLLIVLLLDTHRSLTQLSGKAARVLGRDVEQLASLREPLIFPAMADRLGLLRVPLAPLVASFYANIRHIQFAGKITGSGPTEIVDPPELNQLAKLIEQACRRNALPLLAELPQDEADMELKTKIETISRVAGI